MPSPLRRALGYCSDTKTAPEGAVFRSGAHANLYLNLGPARYLLA